MRADQAGSSRRAGTLTEQFKSGLDRADLPDLGTYLRLQPAVRALPELRRGGGTLVSSARPNACG